MCDKYKQAKEFLTVIHERNSFTFVHMFIEVEDLTIQDMGLVYLDMGDKAYLH